MRQWLRNLRGNKSQKDIAEACGITQQMYCWIELGERRPSVEVAKRIAAVMGFDWTRFYEDEQAAGKDVGATGTEGR